MGLEDRGGSCNMYMFRKGSLCFCGNCKEIYIFDSRSNDCAGAEYFSVVRRGS